MDPAFDSSSPSSCTAFGRKMVCPSGKRPCRDRVCTKGIWPPSRLKPNATSTIVSPLPTINTESRAPKDPRNSPGIMNVGGMMQKSAGPRMDRGRRITERQHHAIRRDRCLPRDPHEQGLLAGSSFDAGHLAEHPLEHHPVAGRAFGLIERVLQIIAVHRPRHEILGIRIRLGLAYVAQKMQRIARLDR